MTPILFLDIDGVLLSGRAWLLPTNQRLQAAAAKLTRSQATELIGRDAAFDACAVALVCRICEASGARVVIASSWRYTVGYEQTRVKLLEQGLPEVLFHKDWACPMARFSTPEKGPDISFWLDEHGGARARPWIVLDDEEVVPGATLKVDGLEGLSASDAAAAVRYLGGTDAGLGVRPLPEGDMRHVVEEFSGHRVEACRWLEGAGGRETRRRRPSALLDGAERQAALRDLIAAAAAHARRWRGRDQAPDRQPGLGEGAGGFPIPQPPPGEPDAP
ncbi:HAD domain-containing protein [Pseudoroseomonas globiformis]|uniref:HAD domain-containing protein n=1 Tax=Teichococcus globiformis TaxID=2307229 RepID=A0ABV7G0U1_9PROT